MKLSNLIRARNVLLSHANDKVFGKVAYKMVKFIKASEDEDAFYNTKIKELIETYAERDENGKCIADKSGNIKIDPSRIQECKDAADALESTDVEVPNIKFTPDELSGLRLSMSEVFALDEFITEEGQHGV